MNNFTQRNFPENPTRSAQVQQNDVPVPRTKLFVGHLPDGCSNDDLFRLFSYYGTVTECDVINKYGFVHMSTSKEAETAISCLNNYELMGSAISVEPSKSKLHLEPGAPGRARGGAIVTPNNRRPREVPRRNGVPPLMSQRVNQATVNEFRLFDSSSNNSHFSDRSNCGQNQIQPHSSFEQPSTTAFANEYRRQALITPAVASHNTFPTTTLTSHVASQPDPFSTATIYQRYADIAAAAAAAAATVFPSQSPPRSIETVAPQNRERWYYTTTNVAQNQHPTDHSRPFNSFY